jgi:hypothetical protein
MKVICSGAGRIADHVSGNYYYCKWCGRHLAPDKEAAKSGGMLFIHDDVFHPPGCTFDSGDEHSLQ